MRRVAIVGLALLWVFAIVAHFDLSSPRCDFRIKIKGKLSQILVEAHFRLVQLLDLEWELVVNVPRRDPEAGNILHERVHDFGRALPRFRHERRFHDMLLMLRKRVHVLLLLRRRRRITAATIVWFS